MAVEPISTERYLAGWRARARDRDAKTRARRTAARAAAQRLAERLVQREGAEAVWLIGSVTTPDRFRLDSDLDLVVSGIAAERFFALWAELEEDSPVELDLIRLESAPGPLRTHIESSGEPLARAGSAS